MRRFTFKSTLIVLLALGSGQLLPAADLTHEELVLVEEYATHEEREVLALLVKLAAPIATPFVHPIGNKFIFGGAGLWALTPLAKPLLGKLSGGLGNMGGSIGDIVKGSAIAAAIAAAWATVVKTIGGANEIKREYMRRSFNDQREGLRKEYRPLIGAVSFALKGLQKNTEIQQSMIKKQQLRQTREIRKIENALDKEYQRLAKYITDQKKKANESWHEIGIRMRKLHTENSEKEHKGAQGQYQITKDAWQSYTNLGKAVNGS